MGNVTDSTIAATDNFVNRIFAGDRTAEEELVAKHWKGIFFILNKRCSDPQLAADLAQDAFIVVIEKARAGKINNPEAVSAFARQTGINLMLAHYRKEKRRETDGFSSTEIDFPDTKTNISQKVELQDTIEFVKQVIEEMPQKRDKDILESFYMQEEEKLDICSRLELSSAHFDRVLFRARNRLKQLIDFKLGGSNVI
ncbi:MAG: RNA polymerase sigma-70 factor (ECF subfamily) [Bermanella sp.]